MEIGKEVELKDKDKAKTMRSILRGQVAASLVQFRSVALSSSLDIQT